MGALAKTMRSATDNFAYALMRVSRVRYPEALEITNWQYISAIRNQIRAEC
jgi:hypothetical protein